MYYCAHMTDLRDLRNSRSIAQQSDRSRIRSPALSGVAVVPHSPSSQSATKRDGVHRIFALCWNLTI